MLLKTWSRAARNGAKQIRASTQCSRIFFKFNALTFIHTRQKYDLLSLSFVHIIICCHTSLKFSGLSVHCEKKENLTRSEFIHIRQDNLAGRANYFKVMGSILDFGGIFLVTKLPQRL